MPSKKILAFSSSRAGNSGYLEKAIAPIQEMLGSSPLRIAFIPFASADSYGDYLSKVSTAFGGLPYEIDLVRNDGSGHVLENCECILVGGGNTFKLLHDLQKSDLLQVIRRRVGEGIPYIGWSAGSNILGESIGTTNDMPILQPPSFAALSIFPFQINPHYLLTVSEDFHGETRDMRLEEFLKINPRSRIVALPEGSYLQQTGDTLKYIGAGAGYLFTHDTQIMKRQILSGADISELL